MLAFIGRFLLEAVALAAAFIAGAGIEVTNNEKNPERQRAYTFIFYVLVCAALVFGIAVTLL